MGSSPIAIAQEFSGPDHFEGVEEALRDRVIEFREAVEYRLKESAGYVRAVPETVRSFPGSCLGTHIREALPRTVGSLW